MADITGTVRAKLGDTEYALRCTHLVLAQAQDLHGPDIGGLLSGDEEQVTKAIPFRAMLDLVALSLGKGSALPRDEALDIADDLLSEDPELAGKVLAAAFPEQAKDEAPAAGNGKRAKRAP